LYVCDYIVVRAAVIGKVDKKNETLANAISCGFGKLALAYGDNNVSFFPSSAPSLPL
jgi:hypothetical protein